MDIAQHHSLCRSHEMPNAPNRPCPHWTLRRLRSDRSIGSSLHCGVIAPPRRYIFIQPLTIPYMAIIPTVLVTHFRLSPKPVFPILGVFRLNGQSKRDDGMIFGSCKASQSPVYPIRDAFLAVNHASCPSLSSSGPRQWGESALKTSRLPGATVEDPTSRATQRSTAGSGLVLTPNSLQRYRDIVEDRGPTRL